MKKRIFFRISVFTFLILLLIAGKNKVQAQTALPDSSLRSFRLFEDDKMIEISLRFDLSTYFRTKPRNEYLKANITFNAGTADSISKDIRLKTRGVFRNRFCMFAPIELNFKKANFGYSDLNRISKLKLVPQCSSGKDKEEYVLREYLAYKLFNVLTDTSFRVRLLTVNYFDEDKKKKPVKQVGIFIEPVEMLAARINCVQVKALNLNQKSIIPRIMDRLSIFNFMIGNYDWSVPGQHNVLVLRSMNLDPNGQGIAIPHDFDWTGVVNASYAVPAENIGTENVRERYFVGVCRSKDVYNKDLDLFLAKKEDFYKVINECPYITPKVKKDITGYLDGFFDQLAGKRNNILYNLTNTCKSF
jgi:hypothetical protein